MTDVYQNYSKVKYKIESYFKNYITDKILFLVNFKRAAIFYDVMNKKIYVIFSRANYSYY